MTVVMLVMMLVTIMAMIMVAVVMTMATSSFFGVSSTRDLWQVDFLSVQVYCISTPGVTSSRIQPWFLSQTHPATRTQQCPNIVD